jgi:TPR repeat protein
VLSFREGFIEKKNPELEYFYTKMAAELGLTEAQHNLACMYLDGQLVKYDSLKALSWFSYAGAAGFSHSQV